MVVCFVLTTEKEKKDMKQHDAYYINTYPVVYIMTGQLFRFGSPTKVVNFKVSGHLAAMKLAHMQT